MKDYLKMADGFKSGSKWFGDALREETGAADELINSAVHAIDSHDELVAEVERLREFERDAMRYRWLMQNTKFGIGRNGKDWDLQVDGSAPDTISEISAWIDNRIGWRM